MTTAKLACATAFVVLAAARTADAQAGDCAQILRFAGESWSTKSQGEKVNAGARYFCSQRFKSEQEAKAAITSAGFPIQGVPFKFTGDFSDDQFRQEQERFCHEEQEFSYTHYLESGTFNMLNAEVAKSVGQCIALQASGLFVWLESTSSDRYFKVHVALRGTTATSALSGFKVKPIQDCTDTLDGPIGGTILTKEVICARDPKQAMVVSVHAATTFALQWVGEPSIPAAPNWNCLYLPPSTAYSTEGDTRTSKVYTCPTGFDIVPGSGRCMTTIPTQSAHVALSEQQGNSWICHWDPPLATGVGIWVEASCRHCQQ